MNWLNATGKEGVFHTDCLSAVYPPASAFPAIASGLLALSVSRTPRDYVLWFRAEIGQAAGGPEQRAAVGENGENPPLHGTIAPWQPSTQLHAHPWLPAEIDCGARLRLSLLEVVLRRIRSDRTRARGGAGAAGEADP